jgi:hypothetical protein
MSDSFNRGRGLKSTVTGKAARNDHTGALIKTKAPSQAYLDNYDRIFGTGGDNDEPKESHGATHEPIKAFTGGW